MYGAITHGDGKYKKNAKNRVRALIFYSDRKIVQLIRTRRDPSPPPATTVKPPSLVDRTRTARLINMVPDTIASPVKLATLEWAHYKALGYRIYGASDGSDEKNDGQSGAFAWVIVAAKSPSDMYILHRGWG
jgi:hypothetical protein